MEGSRTGTGSELPGQGGDGVDRRRPRMSMSFTDLRTPIVGNFLSMLPMGHEKALKYAFYNVLAMVLSSGIIFAFWGVYCILEPFIKSLLWALLCGSVLHPFKGNLRTFLRSWLKDVKKSPTPFAVKISASPLVIMDSLSDQIGNYVVTYWKSIVAAASTFCLTYIFYYNPPMRLAWMGQFIITSFYQFCRWCLSWVNGTVVIALNVAYFGYVLHFLSLRSKSERSSSEPKSGSSDGKGEKSNLNDGAGKDEGDTTTSELSAKKEPSSSVEPSSTNLSEPSNVNPALVEGLSYLSWGTTFAYICLKLPYTLLVPFVVFIVLGVVAYLRGRETSSAHLTIPAISRYACMVVLNIGRESGSGSTSGTGNNSRIVSPRPSIDNRGGHIFPTPNSLNSPDHDHPAAESSHVAAELQRSLSERNDGERLSKPRSFTDSNRSDDTIREGFPSSIEMPSPIFSDGGIDEVEGHTLDSNKFLYWVFCACVIVQIWNHLWLLRLVPIPIFYYLLKKACWKFGLFHYFKKHVKRPLERFYNDVDGPSGYIFPQPIRVAFRIFSAGDRKLVSICETYVDPVTSIFVLVFVLVATILGLIFAATQIYAEGDHLVRVGVNLINSTVSEHPEINEILPEGWQSVMDSMAENAYVYGREYITNMIRDSIAEKNPEKAEILEKQVIEIWDRIYMSWNQTWDNAFNEKEKHKLSGMPVEGTETKTVEWDAILETGKEVPHLLEMSVLVNYARANVGTLWSVFESVWNILVGNISLAFSAVTAVLSIVFGGGTALMNLVLNFVVFFTALFYLLSSSTKLYKPVELFNIWLPGNGAGNSFALAVEEAISGVFVASFKMATFYGMWTWLIHTLFQVNIVFVPSMFAAILGAVPILTPYWAAFPAVLELWLIQGHWPKALCMLLAQMAPMSLVDTQIYSEIKGGGHPYLTGLAVAGGIFCFGSQGAIMGPVVLCCVFVVIKVSGTFMREEPEILQHQPTLSKLNRNVLQSTAGEDITSPKSFNLSSTH